MFSVGKSLVIWRLQSKEGHVCYSMLYPLLDPYFQFQFPWGQRAMSSVAMEIKISCDGWLHLSLSNQIPTTLPYIIPPDQFKSGFRKQNPLALFLHLTFSPPLFSGNLGLSFLCISIHYRPVYCTPSLSPRFIIRPAFKRRCLFWSNEQCQCKIGIMNVEYQVYCCLKYNVGIKLDI